MDDESSEKRALHVNRIVTNAKESMSSRTTFLLSTIIGALPSKLRSTPKQFTALCISVFPGPTHMLNVDGHPVRDMYYVVDATRVHRKSININ